MPHSLSRVLLAIAIIAQSAGSAHAQSRHEIVSGRVTADSTHAVAGADVIVTRAPDFAFKSTRTDTTGRFTVDWSDGNGTYLVRVSAAGYAPATKRVTRSGSDSVIVADVALVAAGTVAKLAPVVTRAQAPRPDRNPPGGVDVGAVEALPGSYRRVPPDLAGDLATLAGTVPGVIATSGGISVLGLAPSQNSVTLNGMAFAGATIPRGVASRVRLSTATYDPANGWFSGARTNVQLGPANELFKRGDATIAADAPAFQANDLVSSRLGQRVATLNAGVDAIGTAFDDRLSYNYALQGSRRSADVTSLLTADAFLLQHAGVSADSAARFTRLLQSADVPLTAAGIPSRSLTDNVVFLGRFDHAPYDWKTLTPARKTWGLTTYVNWTRNEGAGIAPTGTPAHAGQTSQSVMAAQAEYSTFFGHDYLADVRSGLTLSRNNSQPYMQLPDGHVLVSSAFNDATSGVSTLQFGGNGALHNDSRMLTWESISELQLYPQGFARHRIKLTADTRFDAFAQDVQGNSLGTFSYNSLADLAANLPASFTRTLGAPERRGGEWNAFASLGDLWRAAPSLQILYGARLEGNRFVDLPQYNPAVDATFGARTDRAPNTIALLPRAGFTLQRAARGGIPAGTIRGGIGAFRNLLDPALLSTASVSTGLPGALERIACIGSAVPTPDWSAFAADPLTIPSQCAGSTTTSFADAAPNVTVFDPSFTASKSWRSNLSWSSGLWGRTAYTVEGVYSLNLSQPGTIDLNFADVPRFTLADEGRPIFVNSSSIVSATGAVSPVDARRSAAFGRVTDGVSDLRSQSRQIMFTIRPDLGSTLSPVLRDPSFSYVLSGIRAEQRGFSGSTFGDPNDRQWGRGDNLATHQFVAQFIFWPRGTRPGPGLFFYAHLQSGTPFTPLVGNDVNGDGLANDRAFVFDPARAADPALASAMRSLLASSSRTTRACLERQLGAPAARNSCEGPWTAALNMNLSLPGVIFGERFRRANFGLNLANPLGGLDQLLHGSNNLRGWGTPATPDPVLYNVRGFDPAADRFRYDVNPRFGTTSPSINTLRAPFRVSLDMNIDIAPSLPSQQIDRWLTPGRRGHPGTRLTVAELVQRLQRTVPDPYAPLLAQSDSLLLTREQVDAIQTLAANHRAQMDSIYVSISTWLAALPDHFDAAEASARSDDAQQRALEMTRVEVRERLPEILTPVQLTLLPGLTNYFYKAVQPVHERFFIP